MTPRNITRVKICYIASLDEASPEEPRAAAAEVDASLLDSGRPCASRKLLGGTGQTHDWLFECGHSLEQGGRRAGFTFAVSSLFDDHQT